MQFAPDASQRRHSYEKLSGWLPVQAPFEAWRTAFSCAVPLIDGSVVLAGGAAATTAVCADVADALPPPLLAATTTSIVEPMSAPVSVYVALVALAMLLQVGEQRCHW